MSVFAVGIIQLLTIVGISGTVIDSKCHPANDEGGHQPASVRKVLHKCLEQLKVDKLRVFYLR